MSKRVYISADYSELNGDREVVDELHKWGDDALHKVDYVDTAKVVSGSVSSDPDCRPCDLKKEFNSQINASSAVIIIVGDKTAFRTAGSICKRNRDGAGCDCTPYKQNPKGTKTCNWSSISTPDPEDDLGSINDNLCIPLLGSGRAAIREATKENVFQQTVDFLIQSDEKIASKLIISVSPKDYLDERIDLTRMEKYLDYRCEFGKMMPSVPCR